MTVAEYGSHAFELGWSDSIRSELSSPISAENVELTSPTKWERLQQKIQPIYNTYVRWQPLLSDASLCVGCIGKMEVWGHLSELIGIPVDPQKGSQLSKFSFGAIVSVPFALIGAGKCFYTSITAVDASQRVDAALDGIGYLGWAGDSLATSGFGAQSLGWLQNVAVWTTPVAIVSAAFSAVTIVTESLSLREGSRLLSELENPTGALDHDAHEDHSTAALTNLLYKNDYCLHKHFRVDAAKLKTRISEVAIAATNYPTKESTAKAQTTLDALKDRIKSKNFSNKLAIIAAIVGLIGAIILFFTPLGTIALALMAASYAISIIKFIFEYRASRKFEAVLQLKEL